jgi:ankyrin repeat protein
MSSQSGELPLLYPSLLLTILLSLTCPPCQMGDTLLEIAVRDSDVEIAKVLITSGSDINRINRVSLLALPCL